LTVAVAIAVAVVMLSACDASDGSGTTATAEDTSGTTATAEDTSGTTATAEDTSGTTATAEDTSTEDTSDDAPDGPLTERFAGEQLMRDLVGLWRGPAERTPLGNFPLMNMDMRPVGGLDAGSLLFSRADLDADNSLRFALGVERHLGSDVLVFRNGGQFVALDRDTRTVLESHDAAGGVWRFCALNGGCDYVDATWSFSGPDSLTLQVTVRGNQHLTWRAQRVEAREAPAAYPSAEGMPGDAPFPPMPSLRVTVQWSEPLPAEAPVWIVLSTTACGITGRACEASRAIGTRAPAGSTSVALSLHQLHPGPYRLNAILDRDDNITTQVFPSRGDGISMLDQALTVAPSGETTATSVIAITVP
jgi:hypothetical protein